MSFSHATSRWTITTYKGITTLACLLDQLRLLNARTITPPKPPLRENPKRAPINDWPTLETKTEKRFSIRNSKLPCISPFTPPLSFLPMYVQYIEPGLLFIYSNSRCLAYIPLSLYLSIFHTYTQKKPTHFKLMANQYMPRGRSATHPSQDIVISRGQLQ